MNTFTVTTDCGTENEFENRRDAEKGKETHRALCETCDEEDIHIRVNGDQSAGVPPHQQGNGMSPAHTAATAPDDSEFSGLPDSMLADPLDVLPEYMIDVVDGQPTINKRGYTVIANHFDIVVQAEAITTAGETDHQYAEFKARAWKRGDGPENAYTGHATARVSEDRRGIENNLNEMAETRSMKRAVAWASGVGILAWEELASSFEENSEDQTQPPVETSAD